MSYITIGDTTYWLKPERHGGRWRAYSHHLELVVRGADGAILQSDTKKGLIRMLEEAAHASADRTSGVHSGDHRPAGPQQLTFKWPKED